MSDVFSQFNFIFLLSIVEPETSPQYQTSDIQTLTVVIVVVK